MPPAPPDPMRVEAANEPVTVVITRRVRPEQAAAYETWLQRFQAESRALPGYLGVTTQRPVPGGAPEYVCVVRFATLADLRAFEGSEFRQRHLAELAQQVDSDATWQQLGGLEFWFTPPAGTVQPVASPARMALLLIAVVYGLVLIIGPVVNAAVAFLPWPVPPWLRLLITIGIEVVFMTYWLMPRLTKRLAGWIYPRRHVVV